MPQPSEYKPEGVEFLQDGSCRASFRAPGRSKGARSVLDTEEFRAVSIRLTSGETLKFADLKDLQKSDRFGEVLTKVKNDEVFSVDFWAVAWSTEPNTKFINFKPGTLRKAVRAATGDEAFLGNHRNADDSHYGTVTRYKFAADEETGSQYAVARVSAREPEPQRKFLRGTMRSFSSGVTFKAPLTCSACGDSVSKPFAFLDYFRFECDHRPGQMVDGKPVEVHGDGGSFYELSSAPVGAVREAKSTTRSFSATPSEETMPQGTQTPALQGTITAPPANGTNVNVTYSPPGPAAPPADRPADDVGGYKSKFDASQARVGELETRLAAQKGLAEKFALELLAKENLVVGEPDQDTKDIFTAFGLEKGVAFVRKNYRPKVEVSGEEVGFSGPSDPPAPEEKPFVNHAVAEMAASGILKLKQDQRARYVTPPAATK